MNEIKCPKCGEVFEIDEFAYEKIASQVQDKEFEKRIQEKEKQWELKQQSIIDEMTSNHKLKIKELNGVIEKSNIEKQSLINTMKLNHEVEIQKLNGIISKNNAETKIAIEEAIKTKNKELTEKEKELNALQSRLQLAEKEYELEKNKTQKQYEAQLQMKDEQIAQYKDFKAKQSVKLLGESLEQHCEIAFNQVRSMSFPHAYFEKDNDVKTGSKGDYIFRDFDSDKTEIISIMFEMKNEADTTATKKKNADFFKELDKDRNEKKCEYAILVSMLEADNELYNSGITDVSYKYQKMYVIRPQFFIPIIALLRNEAMKALEYKRALITVQQQNVDITNFETELSLFKSDLAVNITRAKNKFDDAIDEIDKTIRHLEKIKENLLGTSKQLITANSKAEDLTIKKLTKNSPSLRLEFEALKDKK
ncbi:MAG: DUF2130 domain-containing protein [Firmicutes bacterium]|nr:DUF2130 domain-containing protein [Bacillota bacterium]